MVKQQKEAAIGTIRVTPPLKFYTKTKSSWKNIKPPRELQQQLNTVVGLFKAHHRLDALRDAHTPQFLKGQLSPQGQPQGARIGILPDGEKLDKAFSLFALHLTLHDQTSHDHWDVLYHNKGGTWSYCYTLRKKKKHTRQKYKKVEGFARVYKKLWNNVQRALTFKADVLALPMYTLLTTYMRIGNEIYYKAHGHKGLTTLQKKDIIVHGSRVTFTYLGKDGVPLKIEQKYPPVYIQQLQHLLLIKKRDDFVFANSKTGHPLHEHEFKQAFKKYCGQEFYPHIVRSYYATQRVKEFLKNTRRSTKEEVQKLYLDIAAHLGHKRFKKDNATWEENSAVTIHHYIQPELVERVKERMRQ